MIKKVFLQTQFGKPHAWTQQFIDGIQHLEKYGWYWMTFTPNQMESKGNHIVVPMTLEEFDELIFKKCGVKVGNFLENGLPHRFVSDFYPAMGLICEDYIKGYDFWGHTNWDIVYGNLSKFIPDEDLKDCDIFSDDINTINGIFTIYKNNSYVNSLFTEIPNWQEMFKTHRLFGMDEYHMTEVAKKASKEGRIKYQFPKYYALHSHDRLQHHVPDVKLERTADGALYELFTDIAPPNWAHARPVTGKEIAYFHFIRTKKWPQNV